MNLRWRAWSRVLRKETCRISPNSKQGVSRVSRLFKLHTGLQLDCQSVLSKIENFIVGYFSQDLYGTAFEAPEPVT